MKHKVLILFIFILHSFYIEARTFHQARFDSNKRWTTFFKKDEENVKNLIRVLAKSTSGKELLIAAKSKADKYGMTLVDIIKVGSGSLTDTTLTRRFSIDDPSHIVYESKSLVFINRELNQFDALLDLAHELTHYVYRTEFNPYLVNFSLEGFIKNTIEGEGGEVQAFLKECQILKELFPSKFRDKKNCVSVTDETTGKLSFQIGVKRFYQLGAYYEYFQKLLSKENIVNSFPDLSDNSVNFVSSVYGAPYPVAAFKEYKAVMEKVCENDKRRLSYFESNSKGRRPASQMSILREKIKTKCSGYSVSYNYN